jgi:hypothetical protein
VAWRGLAWLGLAWLGLAWLGLAWLGLAWLGLAWLGLAETFFILERTERNMIKNVFWSSCRLLFILVRF